MTFLFVILIVNSLGILAFEGLSGRTSLMSYISAIIFRCLNTEPFPLDVVLGVSKFSRRGAIRNVNPCQLDIILIRL